MTESEPQWLTAVLALLLIGAAWVFVTAWYFLIFGLFGVFVIPYRLFTRSQRRSQRLQMQQTEQLMQLNQFAQLQHIQQNQLSLYGTRSEDGQWWWDGVKWLPVTPTPPSLPEAPAPPSLPDSASDNASST
jgi:hypothetical protein